MTTINLVKKLIAMPSVFPHEKAISFFLSDYLKQQGFKIALVQSSLERNNIVATYGSSQKHLGFYGHMDTVPPDQNYSQDPFKTVQKNDRIYGLGASDMKGGITAILKVAEFAVVQKIPIKIIFGVDEENISQGAHDLVSSGKMNDISFLISAESGQVREINQKYSLCFGRKGRILFQITAFGKKSHAADERGINAIDKMAHFLFNIHSLHFKKHQELGSTKFIIHTISGSTDSFSVPDSCSCTISALTNPYTRSPDIIKKLYNLGGKLGVRLKVELFPRSTPYGESYAVDQKNEFSKLLQKRIFVPENQIVTYADSVADENIFAHRLRIPVISLGPIGGGDHIADEWVSVSSIENVISCYQQILLLYHQTQNK